MKLSKKQLDKLNKAISELKQYVYGKIPLEPKKLDNNINILALNPEATMYFLQLMKGRLQTSKLSDDDRDKLFKACTKASESAYWLITSIPDTKFREAAVKTLLIDPKWSMHFRLNRLYTNDIEMHRASKKALSNMLHIGDFLNHISNLDKYEKDLIVKMVMKYEDTNLAGALNAGAYPELKLTDNQKETLQSLITAFKLVKGE